ncbi:uncharacterized protein LOC115076045 isoform X2 [Rhinatrema bivittatum]|uniref:uncharacterized protein LOC115076045 isoform X2 n=1 Tax=Rhinatrema bivittatum TaxID=194408 RepID=UPI00112BD8A1|nr:uncharacterized protein LOC115076045 isoform X2 [Rhinatrema bivittatum]
MVAVQALLVLLSWKENLKVSSGLILGIVLGNLMVLSLFALAAFCYIRKLKKEKKDGGASEEAKPRSTETESHYQNLQSQTSHIYNSVRTQK